MGKDTSEILLNEIEKSTRIAIDPGVPVYIASAETHTGPFHAITALEDTVFDVSAGLTNIKERTGADTIGAIATDFTLPKGITIYGQFNAIDLTSGKVIAYTRKGHTPTVTG